MPRLPVTVLVAISPWLAGALAAQELIHSWVGQPDSHLGGALAAAGDLDGDGVPDVLAGSREGFGRVFAFSGRDGSVLHSESGTDPEGFFGDVIAGGRDLDGDLVPDVLIGSSGEFGRVDVYSGASWRLLYSLQGRTTQSGYGLAVTMLGDVTGDGAADLLVGEPFRPRGDGVRVGHAYLLSGIDGSSVLEFQGVEGLSRFGAAVCSAGDVDLDGVLDVMIGAPASMLGDIHNAVFVYSGADGSLLRRIDGPRIRTRFGSSLALSGDHDGDGVRDHLIGADAIPVGWFGQAYVYSGKTGQMIFNLLPDEGLPGLGQSVAVVPDVNGDGFDEFLLGDGLGDWDYKGEAVLYSGRTGLRLYEYRGEAMSDRMGVRVASVGDVNGDGLAEVLTGARLHDGTGPDSGKLYLFAGDDLFLQATESSWAKREQLEMFTRGGHPGSLTALFLIELGGAPTFSLMQVDTIDADGESLFTRKVPRGLSGMSARFQAFAFHPSGRVVDSTREGVSFE